MTLKQTFSEMAQRKARFAMNAPATREIARKALDCLDFTSLRGNEDDAAIFELCDTAKYNHLFSVCLYPDHVSTAARALKESGVVIATVINYPHGNKRTLSEEDASPESTARDVSRAIAQGAGQIDIVLPHEAYRAGRKNYARSLLAACKTACAGKVKMKVILETASFESLDDLGAACRFAISCGADCLKTSTGKHPNGGADLSRAAVLFDEAHRSDLTGVKISGGITTVEQCAQYIMLARSIRGWNSINPSLFRIGGSNILKPLLNTLQYQPAEMEPSL